MIDNLSKLIDNMPEDEAKSLLHHILIQLDLMETKPSEDRIAILTEIPKQLIESQKPKLHIKESKHVHIAFGDSPAGCIKYMLKQANLTEDYVILFSDAFSIGPIHQLELEAGQVARQQWLSRNLNSYDLYFEEEYLSTFRQSMEELQSIPQDIPITIWKANNAHEHVGHCFVLAHLQDRDNICVINTSEAYRELFSEGYDIRATGELSPEQLAIIYEKYENSVLLTEEERKGFEQEWKLLSETTDLLRIWNENQVQSVPEDYFDYYIIECAEKLETTGSFCKAPRLIGEVLGHIEQVIGDIFLEYRLRKLIQQGVFEMEGTLKAMRYYSIKLKKRNC
ncbi:DUF1835 domain-containing protein [Bacillus cereus]|uniref:DUF1835 domain-containing protein n=1 Tax=Bacillus cereus TaxID=1396 RepID=UPI00397EF12A